MWLLKNFFDSTLPLQVLILIILYLLLYLLTLHIPNMCSALLIYSLVYCYSITSYKIWPITVSRWHKRIVENRRKMRLVIVLFYFSDGPCSSTKGHIEVSLFIFLCIRQSSWIYYVWVKSLTISRPRNELCPHLPAERMGRGVKMENSLS